MAISLLLSGLPSFADFEAFFPSFAPSPAWAPFWYSLYEGVGTCAIVWIQVYFFGLCTEITIGFAGFIAIHLATVLIEAWFAYYHDGWTDAAVAQCLGMALVLGLDMITVHLLYRRPRGRSDPTQGIPVQK
ncbi:hypothetical protein BO78DRAFT_396909 [Aspergillus sclerotiicarbonarius CBS 121057]|uniref:Uncharacterized protein n=1 Tax=Aspergillus sclerotiicarbonarius (strain CBS 121057 / IBT 28362) TaxID=1448318 RepID=A0A319EX47_ASPSB|nr:hypothetical protein BO78DRAFT_396909 [Aspergillus sclerotiicarbonarius CBS 121057]